MNTKSTSFIDIRLPLRISGLNRFEENAESEVDLRRTTILEKKLFDVYGKVFAENSECLKTGFVQNLDILE